MAIHQNQFRMVKWRLLVLHTGVCQMLEKLDQIRNPQVVAMQRRDTADISVQILQVRMFKI